MAKKKFLFVAQEVSPYLHGGDMATLGNMLPQRMQSLGYEVRTFMPKYGAINERRNQLHEVIRLSGINIPINDNDHPLVIKVASLQPARIQVYFIDNDDYFQKNDDDIDNVGSNRSDNDERAIFFTQGTIDTVKKLKWEPNVIHCQGWISALMPLYLRSQKGEDPTFQYAKIVYSIIPGGFDQKLDPGMLTKLKDSGITDELMAMIEADSLDIMALHRLAIAHSDGVIIADREADPSLEQYARELGKQVLLSNPMEDGVDEYASFYQLL